MTPVIKAFFTDKGFDHTNIALQTLGGHGYIKEYGIEQYVRDARIAQIYEGTNAVQALDLVGRKLPMEGGRLVRRFFELVKSDVDAAAQASMAFCTAAVFVGMLNTRGRYFMPALGAGMMNIVMIASVYLLTPLFGETLEQQVFGLAVGVVINLVLGWTLGPSWSTSLGLMAALYGLFWGLAASRDRDRD